MALHDEESLNEIDIGQPLGKELYTLSPLVILPAISQVKVLALMVYVGNMIFHFFLVGEK